MPVLDLKNHSDTPLVTVQVMTCEGDIHLLPRAVASVANQSVPQEQIDLQILFDGMPSPAAGEVLEGIRGKMPRMREFVWDQPTGYYCVPRNRALHAVWGFYLAHLDADNEWKEEHLEVLLRAIRNPHPVSGWPHFVYSRREYVSDIELEEESQLPLGPSALTEWTPENCDSLKRSPMNNFLDTGDFLISASALMELATRTGCVWNSNCRRFGDWDLACRLATSGIRGQAVDVVSHIYHWTGKNLQMTRKISDVVGIPIESYEHLQKAGLIKG